MEKQPNNNNMEVDVENSYQSDVARAIHSLDVLKKRAVDAQGKADEALAADAPEEEYEALMDVYNKKWELYQRTRSNFAARFPEEGVFRTGKASGGPNQGSNKNPVAACGDLICLYKDGKIQTPTGLMKKGRRVRHELIKVGKSAPALKVVDLPFLASARERASGNRALVTQNVREFATAFEALMELHQLNISDVYQRYLPICLGKYYKTFIDSKRTLTGETNIETWPMVKGWLVEFTNTPRQKVKNTTAWMELTPGSDETGEDFFHRVREFKEAHELANISADALLFFAVFTNCRFGWRNKISEAIRDTHQPFLEKTFEEMCAFASDLELNAGKPDAEDRHDNHQRSTTSSQRHNRKRSATDSNHYGNRTWTNNNASTPRRMKGPTGPYPGGGRYCDNGCGEKFMPPHKGVCSAIINRETNDRRSNEDRRDSKRHQSEPDRQHQRRQDRPVSRAASKYIDQVRADDVERLQSTFRGTTLDDDEDDKLPYSGANFSSINKNFCTEHNVPILPHKKESNILLANAGISIKSYGYTPPITIKYNGSYYTCQLEVMDLALGRTMSIGTDLVKTFGIGYTGLAVAWDPPHKEVDEDPFKDKPTPNQDPFGSEAERKIFMECYDLLDTPDDAVCYRAQYPIAHALKPKIKETVDKWLADGIITTVPSTVDNRWNSPLTLAPKKDLLGNYTDKRPCLDPRHINRYLKEDKFPLPKITDIFERLAGANVYTTLDLTNAFHRFPIHPPHQHKTAFTSVDGKQYMFKGCPFGLKPISSKFQRVMTNLFSQEPFHTFVATFIDDIVIFSKTMDEHRTHVHMVIDELTKIKLILNPKKCHFAQKTIYLLGFCVSANGEKSLDPRKVTNTQDWPIPKTGKDIQRFLGLINYFRDFIPLISTLTAPLDALRSHDGRLGNRWTEKTEHAFNTIKDVLMSDMVLHTPNLDLPFHVATDASDMGIGAALYQESDKGDRRHIGFMARSLTKSERNYGTTKRELLAIVFALNKFHQHLWGQHFTLHTDHKALIPSLTTTFR
ncbi:hypothetical protein [Absidia glauca]|uniref:Reverse transcriptase domain-containing protein n=1 Tax=Absidia glauca TaxID=4829 RepID=A0A168NZW5_ABSGL|nr:hypothetical protein [Absidia glauca]